MGNEHDDDGGHEDREHMRRENAGKRGRGMTREEAIKRIKDHMVVHKLNEPRAIKITEALDMAIKALEQKPCEDAISRQAAIDAINRLSIHEFAYEIKTGWIVRGDAVDELRQLPSAQPEIVRCKYCKHREAKDGFCEGRGWPMLLVTDDGFCEKGERIGEE